MIYIYVDAAEAVECTSKSLPIRIRRTTAVQVWSIKKYEAVCVLKIFIDKLNIIPTNSVDKN